MTANTLNPAFELRKSALNENTNASRIFYGPGEAPASPLANLALDLYGDHLWITEWKKTDETTLKEIIEWARENLKLKAIVLMDRTEVASEKEVSTIWGEANPTRFSVKEHGISYLVQMANTKHPGLFLDHAELREYLSKTQTGKTVLNLFSYTGSLSIAAGIGGANHVTTIDLSKPTIEWAKESWANAKLDPKKGDFIYGDIFDWLPRFIKKERRFDTILCDPPSFSRSHLGAFSTKKDLVRLHELLFRLLNSGGTLVTSINSENISEKQFLSEVQTAAENCKTSFTVQKTISLPYGDYLKGFYLQKS